MDTCTCREPRVFLAIPAPRLPSRTTPGQRLRPLGVAAVIHVAAIAAVIATLAPIVEPVAPPDVLQVRDIDDVTRIVFIATPGPGGGGGGGGNRQDGPIPRASRVGSDPLTVPVAPAIVSAEPVQEIAAPQQQQQMIVLDAKPLASGIVDQIGGLVGLSGTGTAQGSGSGGGVGTGFGTGIGSGRGPGVGPGSGGGIGGGVYAPGSGVTPPTLLSQVKPLYTERALRRKVQGSVLLEAIVDREGLAADIHVLRSLDDELDIEAIKAVRQWRFSPGRRGGIPVDVLVTIAVDFAIR